MEHPISSPKECPSEVLDPVAICSRIGTFGILTILGDDGSYCIDYPDPDRCCEFPPAPEQYLLLPPNWSPSKNLAPFLRRSGKGREMQSDLRFALELMDAADLSSKAQQSVVEKVTELDEEGSYRVEVVYGSTTIPPIYESLASLQESTSKVLPSIEIDTTTSSSSEDDGYDDSCTLKGRRLRIT